MFLILALVASAITQTATAGEDKVSPRLTQALVKEFSGAEAIHWQAFKGKDIYQASFVLNHQRLFASLTAMVSFYQPDVMLLKATFRSW